MSDFNDHLPSTADSFVNKEKSASQKVDEAFAAAGDYATHLGRRSAEAYQSGNAAVAARVDPLPGLLLAAAAGFVAGCIWSSAGER